MKGLALACGLVAAGGAGAAEAPQAMAPAGASACSGCHGTPRSPAATVPPLAGRPAADIMLAMAEYRSGARAATVMDRIAKEFSEDETQAIAAWWAGVR